jgi:hypothetical protein
MMVVVGCYASLTLRLYEQPKVFDCLFDHILSYFVGFMAQSGGMLDLPYLPIAGVARLYWVVVVVVSRWNAVTSNCDRYVYLFY